MVRATKSNNIYYCNGTGTRGPCRLLSSEPEWYCKYHIGQRPVATDVEVDATETANLQLRAADEPAAERRYQEEVDAEFKKFQLWKAQQATVAAVAAVPLPTHNYTTSTDVAQRLSRADFMSSDAAIRAAAIRAAAIRAAAIRAADEEDERIRAAAIRASEERRLYQEFRRSQIPVPMPTYTTTADVAQLAQLAQLSSRVDFLTSRLEEMQVKPADEWDLPAVDFAMAVLGHVDQTKCLYVMPMKGVQCPRNKGTGLMCYCTPHVAKQQNRTMKYALELKAKFASKATTAARNKAADSIASGSTGAGASMDTASSYQQLSRL